MFRIYPVNCYADLVHEDQSHYIKNKTQTIHSSIHYLHVCIHHVQYILYLFYLTTDKLIRSLAFKQQMRWKRLAD